MEERRQLPQWIRAAFLLCIIPALQVTAWSQNVPITLNGNFTATREVTRVTPGGWTGSSTFTSYLKLQLQSINGLEASYKVDFVNWTSGGAFILAPPNCGTGLRIETGSLAQGDPVASGNARFEILSRKLTLELTIPVKLFGVATAPCFRPNTESGHTSFKYVASAIADSGGNFNFAGSYPDFFFGEALNLVITSGMLTSKIKIFRFSPEQRALLKKLYDDMKTQTKIYAALTKLCAPCSVITGPLAGITGLNVGILFLLIEDPSDPNFTVIAEPVIPSLPPLKAGPGITQAVADAFNALLLNQEKIIGLGRAAIISLDRAQGASDAGHAFWEARQEQALKTYTGQMAVQLGAQPALLAKLQAALEAAGFPAFTLTPDTALDFVRDIALNGLPEPIKQTLTQLGADSATISQIRNFVVEDFNSTAGDFPRVLTRPTFLSSLTEVAEALKPVSASLPALKQINDLILLIKLHDLDPETRNHLLFDLYSALGALNRGDSAEACGRLSAFGFRVKAKSDQLTPTQSILLSQKLRTIQSSIGCP